jgi:hypothetical protein
VSDLRDFAPAQLDDPAPAASAAALSAQIGLVAQRQEELARAVQRLGTSAAEFDQLRGYVEQIGVILANVAKEVAAQDVTTVQRRVDDLAETVSEVDTLRAEVAAVAEVAENLATAHVPGPVSWWPDLATGDSRAQALESLGVWVDEVLRTRHPEMYNRLGACWYQHADVLDELTALRAAWYAAYRDPEAPATAAVEWHDRWLPGVMRRCRAAIRARGCKARHEKEAQATVPLMARQDFRNFIRLGPDTAVPVNDATHPAGDATDPASEAALANAAAPPWEPACEPVPEQPLWAPGSPAAPTPE